MTLSRKQAERVQNIQNMIRNQMERRKMYGGHSFKPDRIVFQKIQKNLTVWAQNSAWRPGLDSESELHDMLYNLSHIVRSTYDINTIVRDVLTRFELEQCQLCLVRGMIDNYKRRPGDGADMFKQTDLLPSVYSYYVMVK